MTAANTSVQYSFTQHLQRTLFLSGRLRPADFFGASRLVRLAHSFMWQVCESNSCSSWCSIKLVCCTH